ncbi:MAG: Eco57I restriction-modification methylase domain-containing protein [Clostridia bacterium]|nr:Eco57I restriction-modification methylase domain-containing protein [Clostridia bacterium]
MSDSLFTNIYNPDVLSCLANLSNDEVFTPPEIVNNMLDLLPQELFKSPDTKFLDPACKSGVFLREIAKRLIEGLADKIPDLQKRLDHIYHNQLYGIAITELTSLLSRRSVYCSKYPNSKYSVSHFENGEGNIRYKRVNHTFKNGRCVFCGASAGEYDREEGLETHAYELIHTKNPEEIFNMKFDVIIGNPPYQLQTAGSVESQAVPIYNKFVERAIKLNPRYLSMIIPARWLNGGFGLDNFRSNMLSCNKISTIHIYMDSTECFPGVDISGGICYFLYENKKFEKCLVVNHQNGAINKANRPLLEEGIETFIRENKAVSIINKVMSFKEESFENIVTAADPFGLNYKENNTVKMFKNYHADKTSGDVGVYYYGWLKDGIQYTSKRNVKENTDAIDKYKVLISKAYGERGNYPYYIIGKPFLGLPNTVCNMTYIMAGYYDDKETANNEMSYMRTRFFRFLVSLLKSTQNAYKKVYKLVPMQDFSKPWTDEELYKKYNLTQEEIDFIESMIKPMEDDTNE